MSGDDKFPELIFGIAGPIGVDIASICDSLTNELSVVRYTAHQIHLTTEMKKYPLREHEIPEPKSSGFSEEVSHKIDYANALCKEHKSSATLARIALRAIAQKRSEITSELRKKNDKAVLLPAAPTAYIIRQLKRPDEIALLRRVYGRQFILISAYGSAEERAKLLEQRIARSVSSAIPKDEVSSLALKLMARDASEDDHDFGQELRETFHRADVFIDGLLKHEMEAKLNRFVEAFFGRTDIAPSKDEYGMYAAKSASLRSSDLSRQVGAAVFTDDGELITQGCNEVPKANGGTYWDLEEPDFRDVRIGYDPNDILKKEILRDVLDRLLNANLLSEDALSLGPPGQMVEKLTKKKTKGSDEKDGPLRRSSIMDLTEFGRVVHAEMGTICDAARLGRSLKGATLYCTTFPCHNCTKHIFAAGIKRVVYMEPYPKSRAKELHQNEIQIETEAPGKVSFVPFLGISPFRYREIFQKGNRKNNKGDALRWVDNRPMPIIETPPPAYPDIEIAEYGKLFGSKESTDTAKDSSDASSKEHRWHW